MHGDLDRFDKLLGQMIRTNDSVKVGEVEEAAERRARNLQRRQHQMETEVTLVSVDNY